jgi:uncharacterized protein
MRRVLFLSLLFLPVLTYGYYNPGTPSGFVNDFAGILSAGDRQTLETKLSDFEKTSSNEITVAIIPSFGDDTIDDFAVKLFEDWKIGKKNKDNGILFLIARDDRQMRIEVGYGLEGALTDSQAFSIIDEIAKPAFRQSDYAGGISRSVDALIAATKGEYQGSQPATLSRTMSSYPEEILYAVLFAVIWLSSILARSKSWWAGGIVGGVMGAVVGAFFGFIYWGFFAMATLIPLGLLLDFLVSRGYEKGKATGHMPWYIGGGGGHWGGGGFGGFGGGRSGGGGSSGSW